jgi:GNAT superfamily N-acetyltransferase
LGAPVRIRAAEPADVELIFSLIVELAEYERAREKVTGTPALLAEALFGPRPSAEALIAELDDAGAGLSSEAGSRAAGKPAWRSVAFALFHGSFSTWESRPGIWLEDLYVPPEHRRAGIGRALLSEVASIAVARGCARLEWTALDWNTPALEFYAQLGAERLDRWTMHRLDGAALERVATEHRAEAPGDTPS